ncbi:hypothetical protein F4811DRAFT_512771 [Daldinia bambusicola]|nr:hypothetical protein F4811DRAFT_512771 [Daldinia bambusicola]
MSCYVYRRDDEISCGVLGLNPPPILPTHLSWKNVPAAKPYFNPYFFTPAYYTGRRKTK